MPDKTRFDFTHDKPLTAEEIAEVERLVNEKIYADLPVTAVTMPLAEAKKIAGRAGRLRREVPRPGARAADRRRDGRRRRRASISVEFCGGTHLTHTGQAGFFKIVSQEAVGKGVRRVTAVTGREAVATVQQLAAVVDDLTGRFNCKPEELPARVEALQEEIKKLQQQLKKGAAERPGRRRPTSCSPRPPRSAAPRSSSARCRPAPVEQMRAAGRSPAAEGRQRASSSSAGRTTARSACWRR